MEHLLLFSGSIELGLGVGGPRRESTHRCLRIWLICWCECMKSSFDTELGRVVFAKDILNFRFVILTFVGHLLGDQVSPICNQFECLLPDLFDTMKT